MHGLKGHCQDSGISRVLDGLDLTWVFAGSLWLPCWEQSGWAATVMVQVRQNDTWSRVTGKGGAEREGASWMYNTAKLIG